MGSLSLLGLLLGLSVGGSRIGNAHGGNAHGGTVSTPQTGPDAASTDVAQVTAFSAAAPKVSQITK